MEQKILYYLKTHCTGIARAISSDDLSSLFGISTRELRQLKRNIVLNIDTRVGSTSKEGYFYCGNDEDLHRARAEYVSRIRKYKEMIGRYDIELDKKDQKELFYMKRIFKDFILWVICITIWTWIIVILVVVQ